MDNASSHINQTK